MKNIEVAGIPKNKICFVVMGFGKKMDYQNTKMVDLDLVYHHVIQRMFRESFPDYKLIRADEIAGSSIIDVAMYQLLLKADLVIADITTLNLNAIYELGVRHALKPASTVIMMQKSEKAEIPFDLNHSRIFRYEDYGEKLSGREAADIRRGLTDFIKSGAGVNPDSPLYTYMKGLCPPQLTAEDEQDIAELLKDKERIAGQVQNAKKFIGEGKWLAAAGIWEKLHEVLPGDDYIIQQWALSRYKSKYPNETEALEEGLSIIKTLEPEKSLNLETLGITGAIFKRLYEVNENIAYLNMAIRFYGKGYHIKNDYYNGENYAFCLLQKAGWQGIGEDERTYLKLESRMIFQNIIDILEAEVSCEDDEEIDFWMYASLSTSHYCMGNMEPHKKYEEKFLEMAAEDWQKETYQKQLDKLQRLIKV